MTTESHKIALVTGGNRGIGAAIVRGLLAKNCDVIIAARTFEKANAAAAQLAQQLPGTAIPLELDVGSDRSLDRAVETLRQSVDRLDILVNNAGVYPDGDATILTISRELLDSTLQINTFGPLRATQAFLPFLKQSRDARVINVSSSYGALDGLSASVPSYCLSKLALNGATILLAQSLQAQNIAVNSMCPGWVRTDMGGASAPRSPEQGADTAIWLATEAPHNETGQFWRDRQAIPF